MTITDKYPHFVTSLKHFVFYITNGTLIIDKNTDYRSQILSQDSFSHIVYAFCSQINFDEFDQGIFTSIGKGSNTAREVILLGNKPIGKTDNFLDFIVDFTHKLSEGTLIGRDKATFKRAFKEYIFDPAEIEGIFGCYCELAKLENNNIINHAELCYQLGLFVDPDTEFNYNDVFNNMLHQD